MKWERSDAGDVRSGLATANLLVVLAVGALSVVAVDVLAIVLTAPVSALAAPVAAVAPPIATAAAVLPLVVALQFALLVVGAASLGWWTYADASARDGDAPAWWGIAVTAFAPWLLVYLWYRPTIGARSEPVEGREALVGTVAVGVLVALIVAVELSPPDPFATARWTLLATPVGLAVGYLLVVRGGFDALRRAVARLRDARGS